MSGIPFSEKELDVKYKIPNSSIKSPLFYELIYKYSRERSFSNG